MTEFHVYSDKNISFCKTCKEIYDSFHGEEDRQIENIHMIVSLCEKNPKKRYYDATIKDLYKGENIRMKPNYTGLSQSKAYEVVMDVEEDEEEENSNANSNKKQKNK